VEGSGTEPGKRFRATVQIGEGVRGEGWGKNKKEAEEQAARKALEALHLLS
jgi:dsRNA-specific ribonuclease